MNHSLSLLPAHHQPLPAECDMLPIESTSGPSAG